MTENQEEYIQRESVEDDKTRKEVEFGELFQQIEEILLKKATKRIKDFEEKTVGLIWAVILAVGVASLSVIVSIITLFFDNWRVSDEKVKSEVLGEIYKTQLENNQNNNNTLNMDDFKALLDKACTTTVQIEPKTDDDQSSDS